MGRQTGRIELGVREEVRSISCDFWKNAQQSLPKLTFSSLKFKLRFIDP
jgi:hypothetical protein